MWKMNTTGAENDIDRGIDCIDQYTYTLRREIFNTGNRLWLQGLISEIDTGENEYVYRTPDMTADIINEQFDFIILSEANLFKKSHLNFLRAHIRDFSKIRIPVYVVACGAEAPSYEALDDLIKSMGDVFCRFIEIIYNTGGEFALRGEFTKEIFKRLGFPSAVVTGCPSMYQMGRGFVVPEVDCEQDIRPVFNGRISAVKALMKAWPESELIDQGLFWPHMYEAKGSDLKYKDLLALYRKHGIYAAELLRDDRIRLFPDMYNWYTYLQRGGVNYSFGTRIHGNIMAILSGIPATVVAADSRTREMAEFFDIPFIIHEKGHAYTTDELKQCYSDADYSRFNATFSAKYDAFVAFLKEHGIVSRLNDKNVYFDSNKEYYAPPMVVNQDYYRKAADYMYAHEPLFKLGKTALKIKKRILP